MKTAFVIEEDTGKLLKVIVKDCPPGSTFMTLIQDRHGNMIGMKACGDLALTGIGADKKVEILDRAFGALAEIQPV